MFAVTLGLFASPQLCSAQIQPASPPSLGSAQSIEDLLGQLGINPDDIIDIQVGNGDSSNTDSGNGNQTSDAAGQGGGDIQMAGGGMSVAAWVVYQGIDKYMKDGHSLKCAIAMGLVAISDTIRCMDVADQLCTYAFGGISRCHDTLYSICDTKIASGCK
jgi:hypothetical protein